MLQALIKQKIDRYFNTPPYQIEDLLTSVVFGSCAYVCMHQGLLPFLHRAKDAIGNAGRRLTDLLGYVESVEYEFWPYWGSEESSQDNQQSPQCLSKTNLLDTQLEGSFVASPGSTLSASGFSGVADIAGAIPDLVLKFTTMEGSKVWILMEAKLWSTKSSNATPTGPVSDQLGKYWLQLKQKAKDAGAVPLAVLYVTQGVTFPTEEFRATQAELIAKHQKTAPLFWVSWREFVDCVRHPKPIIADVLTLLRERWQLEHVEMTDWPQPVGNYPVFCFTTTWNWPSSSHRSEQWGFSTSWSWPSASLMLCWPFTTTWNWLPPNLHQPCWYFED